MEKKWLEELKVGDSVCVKYGFGRYSVEKVEEITPKGFIKVGGILYSKDGLKKDSDGVFDDWLLNLEEEETQKSLNKYRENKEIEDIQRQVRDFPLTIEQAREIKHLLHKWGFV